MMKAKIICGILALALLSACLSNQPMTRQSPTKIMDISTSTDVLPSALPTMNTTPSMLPSEPWTPSPGDLTEIGPALTEIAAALSATPAPYYDSLPLHATPMGGWKVYTNTQYNFSFEYPSSYDTGACGKLIVRESAQEFEIQVEGGTLSIKIKPANNVDLKEYVQRLIDGNGYTPMTMDDDFIINGVPAVRFMLPLGVPTSAQYQKLALMIYHDKLYLFQYSFQNFVGCDAEPISEEAVYEHLISTWHFLR